MAEIHAFVKKNWGELMAEKYYELLQKANMSESKDPQQFYALLKEALAILKNPQNQISIELTHIPILERRLLFYDDRESDVKAAAQKLSLLLAPHPLNFPCSRIFLRRIHWNWTIY